MSRKRPSRQPNGLILIHKVGVSPHVHKALRILSAEAGYTRLHDITTVLLETHPAILKCLEREAIAAKQSS